LILGNFNTKSSSGDALNLFQHGVMASAMVASSKTAGKDSAP